MVEVHLVSEDEVKFTSDSNELFGEKNPETNFWFLRSNSYKYPGEYTSRDHLKRGAMAIFEKKAKKAVKKDD